MLPLDAARAFDDARRSAMISLSFQLIRPEFQPASPMNSIKDNAFRFLLMCAAGLVLAVLIRCDPSWGQSGSPRSRVALLIGNASYPDASAPLQQPTKSIHILADELRRSGFRVDTRENLGKQELLRAVDEFKQAIVPGSAALFFFSGYGLQKDRESFVIPVDAQIWTEADIARDGVSIEAILSDMGRARVKLMILDASRRNPYERRFRRAPAGLAPIIAPAGSLIMSAAAPGKVLDDTGIFINELVKEMRGPALTVETIVSRARRGVARLSKGEQLLWMSSLVDDFFLRNRRGPRSPTVSSNSQRAIAPTRDVHHGSRKRRTHRKAPTARPPRWIRRAWIPLRRRSSPAMFCATVRIALKWSSSPPAASTWVRTNLPSRSPCIGSRSHGRSRSVAGRSRSSSGTSACRQGNARTVPTMPGGAAAPGRSPTSVGATPRPMSPGFRRRPGTLIGFPARPSGNTRRVAVPGRRSGGDVQ